MIKTICWENERVMLLDQTRLPLEQVYLACEDYREVAGAIKRMVVRGAPAIGVAAAMGIALGATQITAGRYQDFRQQFENICREFAETRPTAVNLFWAIERMKRLVNAHSDSSVEALQMLLKEEAVKMGEEDIRINRQIGEMGNDLHTMKKAREESTLFIMQAFLAPGARVLHEDLYYLTAKT